MSALAASVVLGLAMQCAPFVKSPEVLVGIAKHESGFDPSAVNRNPNGTADFGLMQVNEANFKWLGLDHQSALDPCRSMEAGARVFMAGLSRYNTGSPTAGMAYASKVVAATAGLSVTAPASAATPPQITLEDQLVSFTTASREIAYR